MDTKEDWIKARWYRTYLLRGIKALLTGIAGPILLGLTLISTLAAEGNYPLVPTESELARFPRLQSTSAACRKCKCEMYAIGDAPSDKSEGVEVQLSEPDGAGTERKCKGLTKSKHAWTQVELLNPHKSTTNMEHYLKKGLELLREGSVKAFTCLKCTASVATAVGVTILTAVIWLIVAFVTGSFRGIQPATINPSNEIPTEDELTEWSAETVIKESEVENIGDFEKGPPIDELCLMKRCVRDKTQVEDTKASNETTPIEKTQDTKGFAQSELERTVEQKET